MNALPSRVPSSLPADSGDVAVALEVAAALWEKGDGAEALRWLRRAVDAASQAGDAERMADLDAAARDLEAATNRKANLETLPAPPESMTEVPPPPAPASALPPAETRPVESRVRVCIEATLGDPNLLLVRPLPEGQPPPPGTRAGFLLIADGSNGPRGENGD